MTTFSTNPAGPGPPLRPKWAWRPSGLLSQGAGTWILGPDGLRRSPAIELLVSPPWFPVSTFLFWQVGRGHPLKNVWFPGCAAPWVLCGGGVSCIQELVLSSDDELPAALKAHASTQLQLLSSEAPMMPTSPAPGFLKAKGESRGDICMHLPVDCCGRWWGSRDKLCHVSRASLILNPDRLGR